MYADQMQAQMDYEAQMAEQQMYESQVYEQQVYVNQMYESRVYEEQILKGHPFSEEQARSLARPEIVACAFRNKSNQIGALVSYQNAFYPQT